MSTWRVHPPPPHPGKGRKQVVGAGLALGRKQAENSVLVGEAGVAWEG